MKTSILITISELTHADLAIDMALAASAFEVQLSILFEESGKTLLETQEELSELQKKISAWPWYDIRNLYVQEPWPKKQKMLLNADLVNEQEIQSLFEQHDILLRY